LVNKKIPVKVCVTCDKEDEFTSKIIKIAREDVRSKFKKDPQMIIGKLVPERGNMLILNSSDLTLKFSIDNNFFRCVVRFVGISGEFAYLSYALTYPDVIEIKEKRREETSIRAATEFISIEFNLKKGIRKKKVYHLELIDRRMHGLGVLIPKKDVELVQILQPGDELKEIAVYAETCMVKVNGVVRHLTKVKSGKNKGSYLLGIESPGIVL
jgi:hypothetical protein